MSFPAASRMNPFATNTLNLDSTQAGKQIHLAKGVWKLDCKGVIENPQGEKLKSRRWSCDSDYIQIQFLPFFLKLSSVGLAVLKV